MYLCQYFVAMCCIFFDRNGYGVGCKSLWSYSVFTLQFLLEMKWFDVIITCVVANNQNDFLIGCMLYSHCFSLHSLLTYNDNPFPQLDSFWIFSKWFCVLFLILALLYKCVLTYGHKCTAFTWAATKKQTSYYGKIDLLLPMCVGRLKRKHKNT